MSCIAGVGGDVKSLVHKAFSESGNLFVLDGCRLSCAKECLARHGIEIRHHFILSDYGVKKTQHADPDPWDVERLTEEVKSLL